ncbi:MAG: DNA-binding response regulator [Bacteroidota bacterium]|nr:MAG: response regulator of the LytR/AlgR family protein [Bacteroidetes bacterium OLB12]GIL22682.1 MAG: DNA-binding response regulator [Bacteroidota bacterium]HNR73929.1 LytTR family DNA-binding domain-containing protein [Cyclobacteriaceae bacterium]HNU42906.1 LytTR family DNA-binding domain-containing protein [Cyclobacteriaceae bacterium]
MIRCVIIDDEPVAISILENYISKTPFLHLVAKCLGATEAMQVMQTEKVDLLFLDIQMPDITGIEFSKSLGDSVKIIFTTAYEKYALEGYKVNAIDYLLKPFDYQEFLKAAMKAKTWFDLKNNQAENTAPQKDSLLVNSEYKLIKIELKNILYIEGLKDYVKIFIEDTPRPVMTLMTMKSLEEQLPRNQFMRVHRSYIISLNKIDAVERSGILIGKTLIPVADKYKEVFNEYLSKNFLR